MLRHHCFPALLDHPEPTDPTLSLHFHALPPTTAMECPSSESYAHCYDDYDDDEDDEDEVSPLSNIANSKLQDDDGVTAILMRDDENGDVNDAIDIEDEDEVILTINAVASAVTMVAHIEAELAEPQTPWMPSSVRLFIVVARDHKYDVWGEAQARANMPYPLMSPLFSPLLPTQLSPLLLVFSPTSAAVTSTYYFVFA